MEEKEELQEELKGINSNMVVDNEENKSKKVPSQLEEEEEDEDEVDVSDWSDDVDDKVNEQTQELELLKKEEEKEELQTKETSKVLEKKDSTEESISDNEEGSSRSSSSPPPSPSPPPPPSPPLPQSISIPSSSAIMHEIEEFAMQESTDDKKQTVESTNEELNAHIMQTLNNISFEPTMKQSKLDPKLLDYLEKHSDILTLSFLETAHETLLEIKAIDPNKNLNDYLEELKSAQSNFNKELEKLRSSNNEVELKLKLLKQDYEKELSSFNDSSRVEHILKNTGTKEYLDRLKEKNKIKDDTIQFLKLELETKRKALADCEAQRKLAEDQLGKYLQAEQDAKAKREQLEAERRARENRMISHAINLSSASSLVDSSIPPLPTLNNIPSIDELLKYPS